ncbi:hypothetical protein FBU30_008710 [Linnemannia zychae]|nr:hypothetical protein FBU30_008710 [Linnemannia zychae]
MSFVDDSSFEARKKRMNKLGKWYCAVCSEIPYDDEIQFLNLTVEQFRATRPFYCSLVAGGAWTEIVSAAALEAVSLKSALVNAPKTDDRLNEVLAHISSAAEGSLSIVSCKAHKRLNDALRTMHSFFRTHLQPGLVLEKTCLPQLRWEERQFLAPIMVFTALRRPRYARKLGVRPVLSSLELSDSVTLYQSAGYTEYAGVCGIVARQKETGRSSRLNQIKDNREGIVQEWWQFLKNNNPLFAAYLQKQAQNVKINPALRKSGAIVSHQVFQPGRHPAVLNEPVSYLLSAEQIGPYEIGPWMDTMGVLVGIDMMAGHEVQFKNPNLLDLLFPWLFPFGEGFFFIKDGHEDTSGPSITKGRIRRGASFALPPVIRSSIAYKRKQNMVVRCNMDLQFNVGEQARYYLCKYTSKQVPILNGSFESFNGGQSLAIRYQKLGMLDIVFDIMGYHLHRISRGVLFLPTDLPEKRFRRPRSNYPPSIHDLDPIDPLRIDVREFSPASTVSLPDPSNPQAELPDPDPDFENMSYVTFMTSYIQVYGHQTRSV